MSRGCVTGRMTGQEGSEIRDRAVGNFHLRRMPAVGIDHQLRPRDRGCEPSAVLHRDQPVIGPVHHQGRRADPCHGVRRGPDPGPVLHAEDDRRMIRRMAEIGEAVDHPVRDP